MKKIFITFTILAIGFVAMAQEEEVVQSYEPPRETNKFLPNGGDIAIGLDATPFLNYLGNMFNNENFNQLNLSDPNLYFRYYLNQDAAVRLSLRVSSTTNDNRYYVQDDAAVAIDPLSNAQVEDREKSTNNQVELKLGYMMFHNYKRFRGFYGADLGYGYSKTKTIREYGNEMSALNPTPTTNWGALANRSLETDNGATHGLGLSAFCGGEFFFLPRVCIGGELGLSYYYGFETQSYTTSETMVLTQRVEEEIATDPGDRTQTIQTSFPYYFGNLYLMFHF